MFVSRWVDLEINGMTGAIIDTRYIKERDDQQDSQVAPFTNMV